MSKRTWAVLALLGSTLIWGLGPVVTKVGLLEVPAFSLAFLAGTVLILGGVFLATTYELILPRKIVPRFIKKRREK